MERSVHWYIGSLHILTNIYTAALSTKQFERKEFNSTLFNRTYYIIVNNDDLTKENARIKEVLKKIDIKEALLVKSLKVLLIITAFLSHNSNNKPQISKKMRSGSVKNSGV